MADIQDYISTPKYETFSYLPALSPEGMRRQIAYIVKQGWNPAPPQALLVKAEATTSLPA